MAWLTGNGFHFSLCNILVLFLQCELNKNLDEFVFDLARAYNEVECAIVLYIYIIMSPIGYISIFI